MLTESPIFFEARKRFERYNRAVNDFLTSTGREIAPGTVLFGVATMEAISTDEGDEDPNNIATSEIMFFCPENKFPLTAIYVESIEDKITSWHPLDGVKWADGNFTIPETANMKKLELGVGIGAQNYRRAKNHVPYTERWVFERNSGNLEAYSEFLERYAAEIRRLRAISQVSEIRPQNDFLVGGWPEAHIFTDLTN